MNLSSFPAEVRTVLSEANQMWSDIEFSLQYARRALLHGDPGTGKTRAGSNLGRKGGKLIRTMITPETCAAEVRGHWVITPNGTAWIDGPGLASWREPHTRLVIDEIDQAGGDTIPLLHALLDDTAVAAITLPDGSTVKPKEGFTVVATMNSDPIALPEALRDRFVVKHHVKYPKPEFLGTLPEQIRPFAALAVYKRTSLPENLTSLRSTRTWVELGRLMTEDSLGFSDALRAIAIPEPVKMLESAFPTLKDRPLSMEA